MSTLSYVQLATNHMGGWTQTESNVICNDLGYEFTGKFEDKYKHML